MVTEVDEISIFGIVVAVVVVVNIFVYVYAVYHLFSSYSEVKFMYLAFSFLSWMVAVLYDYVGRRLTSVVMHVISILFAVRVVS
jgi:hypothetical protein